MWPSPALDSQSSVSSDDEQMNSSSWEPSGSEPEPEPESESEAVPVPKPKSVQIRPLFTAEEERDMVTWLTRCAAQGLAISRAQFIEEVQRIVLLEQRGVQSEKGVSDWLAAFESRFSDELRACRHGPLLTAGAAPVRSPTAWYRSVSAALAAHHPTVDFADPERVFCLGEVNLRLDVASRVTSSALMTYLVKSLEPYLASRAVARPVLLYVDGLRHRCGMTLSQFCDDEQIVLVGLPPAGQPTGCSSVSLSRLVSGIRQATRRACKETIAQAFT
ncbi:uncharacterized protein LOC119110173 [Pollicipes pollicipes]|uniref:uncharacterized protein LOC119110173 n=1 Tax=Pollicipes pollicipes TaxID=41117 RepID=UPI001885218D|nr:uncharacterized protein LOC119110173 [Pollicipes pollicipes]